MNAINPFTDIVDPKVAIRLKEQRDLVTRTRAINDLIFSICIEKTVTLDASFSNLLWQTLAANGREITRKLADEPGSPAYVENLETFRLMALVLLEEHIRDRQARLDAGQPVTEDDHRIANSLVAALDTFAEGREELALRFPGPSFDVDSLAKHIWMNLWNVTVEEAYKLAHRAIAMTNDGAA